MIPVADVDDSTLAKAAAEDFHAFAELYRRYLSPVFRFARSQLPSDAAAEDVTAQVFFKALSSAGTFRGDSSYASWLFRIAHNLIHNWRRQRSRAPVAVDELPENEDPTPCPATQVVAGERRNLVWNAVADLPSAQREVVSLRYQRDFSVEEIAAITNRSRGAVRILLHRARLKLRHALEGKDVR